ncbi:Rieske 2Fe-2S domain-containing protein [Eoetvoesiella caeni]
MFLKNCWYMAGWDYELIDSKMLARKLLNEPVLFYRGESGKVVALADRCCHRGAALSMGRREGDDVRCMYHGLKFNADGKCIEIPGQEMIPPKLGVHSYPVVERDHLIWIWMGDPALADESQIIDFPYLSDPAWRGMPDYIHYESNYLLIVDNLSDFAHLAWVHTHTLGGSEEYAYKTKPASVERLERGFRVTRWHMNSAPPPFHRKVIDNNNNVDRWNVGHMQVPGIFFLESGFAPAGAGAEKGNKEGAKEYRNCQFITPETESTTHFFFSYLHNFEVDNYNVTLSLHDSLIEGFMEDKHIIERQQRILDEDPDFKLLAIAADGPLSHFRWTMDKLIAAERQQQAVPQAQEVQRNKSPAVAA